MMQMGKWLHAVWLGLLASADIFFDFIENCDVLVGRTLGFIECLEIYFLQTSNSDSLPMF